MAKSSLADRIERIEAELAVQKVMSKYEHCLTGLEFDRIDSLFAQKTPGVMVNIGDWGAYKGVEGVRRLFVDMMGKDCKNTPGFLAECDLTNSVIEIAGDKKTAKAVWMAPGIETIGWRDETTGKVTVRPGWCYTKYACDFVKEDGVWKLWHLNNFLTFFADYNKSWAVDGGEHYTRRAGAIRPLPPELRPDGPPTHRHDPYNPNEIRDMLPAFPEPYETYDGSQDWIDPKAHRK